MSFKSYEQFYTTINPLHEDYIPSAEVVSHTKLVHLTPVVGPAGVGKDTLMTLTGLPKVRSDTTRSPRLNNGQMEQDGLEYNFRDNDLEGFYGDVVKGRFVQWAPGPNNKFYGSLGSAYPEEGPALIDIVAKSVQRTRELARYFGSIEVAYVVANSYESWINRFKGRGEISDEDFKSRLEEARHSLEFGLEDNSMHFIVNDDREIAASRLNALALRESSRHDEVRAKNFGAQMLIGIKQELGLPINL